MLQAVQLLQEHDAVTGQTLKVTASHDTYSIRFEVDNSAQSTAATADTTCCSSGTSVRPNTSSRPMQHAPTSDKSPAAIALVAPEPINVPLYDQGWRAAYDSISQLQGQLAKAITQDPLEYKRMASAALLLAMRPWVSTGAVHGADGVAQTTQHIDGAHSKVQSFPVADPHHAAAMLVSLMT